jgi:hypothetical protein
MADFCRLAVAASPAFGWDAKTFTEAYDANRASANDLALESAHIFEPLRQIAEDGGFEGSLAELLDRLGDLVDEEVTRRKAWPRSERALVGHLKRIAPNMRAVGIEIGLDKQHPVTRRRVVEVQKKARQDPSNPSDPSARHESPKDDPAFSKDAKGAKGESQPFSSDNPPNGQIQLGETEDESGGQGNGGLSTAGYVRRWRARAELEGWS